MEKLKSRAIFPLKEREIWQSTKRGKITLYYPRESTPFQDFHFISTKDYNLVMKALEIAEDQLLSVLELQSGKKAK